MIHDVKLQEAADRRTFLRLGSGLALALAVHIPTRAQSRAKVPQIGVVTSNVPLAEMTGPRPRASVATALVEGLRDWGWIVGKSVKVHWRSAEQHYQRRPALIEELLRIPVDVLVVAGNAATLEARALTRELSIVSIGLQQPVKAGLVASLARPGGNVTGLMLDAGVDIESKRLALLKQMAPGVTRIAFLAPDYAGDLEAVDIGPETLAASRALGLSIFDARFENIDRIETVIDAAVRRGADGLFVGNWAEFYPKENQARVARAAESLRLPTVFTYPDGCRNGGLIAYGSDWDALYRRAGYMLDRILKGGKPGEIPMEQASRYLFEINRKTARAIGLVVPPALLAAADRVIE